MAADISRLRRQRQARPDCHSHTSNALTDHYFELRDSSGTLIQASDDWRTGGQEQEIIWWGLPAPDDAESAMLALLPAGGAA